MSNSLRITVPVQITDPMVTDTDVPEADYAVWTSGTTYALGARVIKGHVIWESAQDANTGHDPETSGSAWWLKVSATNRWRLFDLEQVTRTTRTGNMYYEIEPGMPVDSLHILGMNEVDYVQVKLYDGVTLIKDYGQSAAGMLPQEADWWGYCYGPWVITTQQHYKDLPYLINPKFRIDFGADSEQSVQVLMLGNSSSFGVDSDRGVKSGVRVRYDRVVNFSSEDFGIPTMKSGAVVATASFTLVVKSSEVDELNDFYVEHGGKVCLFSISDLWRTTQVLGKITSFDALIHGPVYSEFAFEIRGVPQQ